jgi:hypothetical protein
MIMFNYDSWPTISVAITVDNHRLVPVSVTVPITIDDDGFVAIAVPISISMDCNAARSYSNTNVVSQSRRNGAKARGGAYNKRCADHITCSLVQPTQGVNSRQARSFPDFWV